MLHKLPSRVPPQSRASTPSVPRNDPVALLGVVVWRPLKANPNLENDLPECTALLNLDLAKEWVGLNLGCLVTASLFWKPGLSGFRLERIGWEGHRKAGLWWRFVSDYLCLHQTMLVLTSLAGFCDVTNENTQIKGQIKLKKFLNIR